MVAEPLGGGAVTGVRGRREFAPEAGANGIGAWGTPEQERPGVCRSGPRSGKAPRCLLPDLMAPEATKGEAEVWTRLEPCPSPSVFLTLPRLHRPRA